MQADEVKGEFQERISWGMLPFEGTEEILRSVGLIIYKKCPKDLRKKVWSTISYDFWYFLMLDRFLYTFKDGNFVEI